MVHQRNAASKLESSLPCTNRCTPGILVVRREREGSETLALDFSESVDVEDVASLLRPHEGRRHYAVVVVEQSGAKDELLRFLREIAVECPCARCIWAAGHAGGMIEAFNEQLLWRAVVQPGDRRELERHVREALSCWRSDKEPRAKVRSFLGC